MTYNVSVVNGVASVEVDTTDLSEGVHLVTASYQQNNSYKGSSATANLTVNPANYPYIYPGIEFTEGVPVIYTTRPKPVKINGTQVGVLGNRQTDPDDPRTRYAVIMLDATQTANFIAANGEGVYDFTLPDNSTITLHLLATAPDGGGVVRLLTIPYTNIAGCGII